MPRFLPHNRWIMMLGRFLFPESQRAALLASLMAGTLLLGACADRPLRTPSVSDAIRTELAPARPAKVVVPNSISDALAEPAQSALPVPPEPRLDLLVNNAQAREVFLAIVADTRYSMLMHPEVAGTLSVTLRGVTVREALEAIRDVYGYDFKIDGRRVTVFPPTLQTRIFTINYPLSQRVGRSELRVSSGSAPANTGTAAGVTGAGLPTVTGGSNTTAAAASANAGRQVDSSRVSTSSSTDFWTELSDAIRSLLGNAQGTSVIASPQAGIIAVRAMPDQLRHVEKFLKAAQVAVERQVMLEAKIVEVELRDGYQSGINWGAFNQNGDTTALLGVLGGAVPNANIGPFFQGGQSVAGAVTPIPSIGNAGGLFGLALATSQFGAVLGFLETQGDVQTLSSPRVATLNNQKAVLKVGSDDYFVTNVTGGSTTSGVASGGTATTTLPNLTLTPFFSGVALDVTPQIDDGNNIMLHIHPSVTSVTERTKEIDLGSAGQFRLPLASSSVNETDTLVRIQDGNIVAIGGLMQTSSSRTASGLPGTTNSNNAFSFMFGNKANSGRKKELVVLIKPSIIRSPQDWETQTARSRAALEEMNAVRSRVIQIDGSVQEAPTPASR